VSHRKRTKYGRANADGHPVIEGEGSQEVADITHNDDDMQKRIRDLRAANVQQRAMVEGVEERIRDPAAAAQQLYGLDLCHPCSTAFSGFSSSTAVGVPLFCSICEDKAAKAAASKKI